MKVKRGLISMKEKALSDTIIKIVAEALPLGRALLKERRSRPAWLGSIGDRGGENV